MSLNDEPVERGRMNEIFVDLLATLISVAIVGKRLHDVLFMGISITHFIYKHYPLFFSKF